MSAAHAGWFESLDGCPVEQLASPNFGERPPGTEISLLVIHNISLPPGEFGGRHVEDFFLNRLDPAAHPYFECIADLEVSAHFYIRRDGRVVQFVAAGQRAWHAGRSCWAGRENCNDYSIGVELEGTDDCPFSEAQYTALSALLGALRAAYPIRALAGHSDIAPGRKTDPGPCFDWARLRRENPDLDFPETAA